MSRICVCLFAGASVCLLAINSGRAQTLNPIGINVAADSNGTVGSMTGEQPELEADDTLGTPPQAGTAGVVPINNWNNLVITRFKPNSNPAIPSTNLPLTQPVASCAIPFAINDSTGAAVAGAAVTAWTGGDSFSVYGQARQNNDAQLVNGFLGTQNNPSGTGNIPDSITVTLPSGYVNAGYSVYVYFNANAAKLFSDISLTSGSFTSPTYYELTQGNTVAGIPFNNSPAGIGPNGEGIYTYTDGSADNSTTNSTGFGMTTGTAPNFTGSLSANYVVINVPAGAGSSFTASLFEPISTGTGSGNPGIAALEIVPVPEPASLALLLLGAAPAAWVVSRRRKIVD